VSKKNEPFNIMSDFLIHSGFSFSSSACLLAADFNPLGPVSVNRE